MLPWKKLIEDARSDKIDRRPERALAWIHRYLPELSLWYVKADGSTGLDRDLFDWRAEWPKWQERFEALHWLVEARAQPRRPGAPDQLIPLWVQHPVDELIHQTRNAILSDWLSEAHIRIQLSGTYTASGRFQTLDEFWQAVFVSFFQPGDLALGYCSDCGKQLPPTPKLQKASRSKLCPACRVKKWRREHPEEAREMWRQAKASAAGKKARKKER
jgi:hypothetical protein